MPDMTAIDSDDEFGEIDDEELILLTTNAEKTSVAGGTSLPFGYGDLKRRNSYTADDSFLEKRIKLRDDDPVINLARGILRKTWGFQEFRLKQEVAIVRLITGGNAAVVFPAGGGKSVVYQVPALAFDEYDKICGRTRGEGVTLVVSPLIALMKDQVDVMKRKGVAAAAMDSSQKRETWLEACDNLRKGQLKLLYVAPERLNNEGFVEMIKEVRIRMIAIDEAHCISEWGHAFRPDYLKSRIYSKPYPNGFGLTSLIVARFVKESKAERVLCLTATVRFPFCQTDTSSAAYTNVTQASPIVATDICKAFDIGKDGLFRTTTYRSK